MVDREKINNPILKQSKEHKLVFGYIAEIDRLAKENNSKALTLLLRRILKLFMTDLQKHFSEEERVFFQAAIKSGPSAEISSLIEELKKEHVQIARKLRTLDWIVKDVKLTTQEQPEKVTAAVKPILDFMKQHIMKEISQLFPYINGNPKCLSLIEELSAAEN